MDLYIKNMVCNRCKMVVKDELEKLNLHPVTIELGEVTIAETTLSKDQLTSLNNVLTNVGFELIDDDKSKYIEKIKNIIIELVHYTKEQPRLKYSEYIADKVHHDYAYLSKLFSDVEGITIEHYIINQKIERVKELLVYNQLTLSEIAFELGYSSVAHLSTQFKKVTGLTPSHFKEIKQNKRIALDKIGITDK